MTKSNSGKPISQMKIQQIFKQYQRNTNQSVIARKTGLHPDTVSKYVKNENMEERRRRILDMASERILAGQADQLVRDITDTQELKDLAVDSIITRIESGEYAPSIADIDRLQRLLGHLLQTPDAIVEHRDASIEVQRVKRQDVLDLDTQE